MYVVDVATSLVKLYSDLRRVEHVDHFGKKEMDGKVFYDAACLLHGFEWTISNAYQGISWIYKNKWCATTWELISQVNFIGTCDSDFPDWQILQNDAPYVYDVDVATSLVKLYTIRTKESRPCRPFRVKVLEVWRSGQ